MTYKKTFGRLNHKDYEHDLVEMLQEFKFEVEYTAEEIYDFRITNRNGLQYLVKWMGENETTWEPVIILDDTVAVEKFHSSYPPKSGPLVKIKKVKKL